VGGWVGGQVGCGGGFLACSPPPSQPSHYHSNPTPSTPPLTPTPTPSLLPLPPRHLLRPRLSLLHLRTLLHSHLPLLCSYLVSHSCLPPTSCPPSLPLPLIPLRLHSYSFSPPPTPSLSPRRHSMTLPARTHLLATHLEDRHTPSRGAYTTCATQNWHTSRPPVVAWLVLSGGW